MLKEWSGVRQRPDEGRRRWFRDEKLDLIVWYRGEEVEGFQLCYDTDTDEKAITWYASGSYVHAKVDDGERPFGSKASPILVSDGVFDAERIASEFKASSAEIDPGVAELVYERLKAYRA